eukprot:403128-Pleurochrysis_carterae.AAC.2
MGESCSIEDVKAEYAHRRHLSWSDRFYQTRDMLGTHENKRSRLFSCLALCARSLPFGEIVSCASYNFDLASALVARRR